MGSGAFVIMLLVVVGLQRLLSGCLSVLQEVFCLGALLEVYTKHFFTIRIIRFYRIGGRFLKGLHGNR